MTNQMMKLNSKMVQIQCNSSSSTNVMLVDKLNEQQIEKFKLQVELHDEHKELQQLEMVLEDSTTNSMYEELKNEFDLLLKEFKIYKLKSKQQINELKNNLQELQYDFEEENQGNETGVSKYQNQLKQLQQVNSKLVIDKQYVEEELEKAQEIVRKLVKEKLQYKKKN